MNSPSSLASRSRRASRSLAVSRPPVTRTRKNLCASSWTRALVAAAMASKRALRGLHRACLNSKQASTAYSKDFDSLSAVKVGLSDLGVAQTAPRAAHAYPLFSKEVVRVSNYCGSKARSARVDDDCQACLRVEVDLRL